MLTQQLVSAFEFYKSFVGYKEVVKATQACSANRTDLTMLASIKNWLDFVAGVLTKVAREEQSAKMDANPVSRQ